MELTKQGAYDVAVKIIKDADVENSISALHKTIGCVLDDNFNIIKRFYDNNTKDCPYDAKISIFLTMEGPFWSGIMRTYEKDTNDITLQLVHVENPIMSKAELVEKLVNCNKNLSELMDRCRVTDVKSVTFRKAEDGSVL